MSVVRTAYVFRCLLCGRELNGELDSLDEPWRGMAQHLAGLPAGDRQDRLNLLLMARTDRDELISAMIETKGP